MPAAIEGNLADLGPSFGESRIERHSSVQAPGLNLLPRDVVVYLPPGYGQDTSRSYPVLYMHDGQNIFQNRDYTGSENTWSADIAADRLIKAGVIPPIVIVGVFCTAARFEEYSGAFEPALNCGGKVHEYGRFITEHLQPAIEARYRIAEGPENTAMLGSSMGALATAAIALTRPDLFGSVGLLSPAVWWGGKYILGSIPPPTGQRVWLDIGTCEGGEDHALSSRTVENARLLKERFNNWSGFSYFEDRGAGHSEQYWAARLLKVLPFLFGQSGTTAEPVSS